MIAEKFDIENFNKKDKAARFLSFLFKSQYFAVRTDNRRDSFLEDIFFEENGCDIRDDVILIGKIEEKRINHIAFFLGIMISEILEVRFDDNKEEKDAIDGLGRTSGRVIISPEHNYEFIEWCENNYYPLTYTKGKGTRTIDYYTFMSHIGAVEPEWFTEEERKKVIYFRFDRESNSDSKFARHFKKSKQNMIDFVKNRFGDIDIDEFNRFFEMGVNLIPINNRGVFDKKIAKMRNLPSVKKFIVRNLGCDKNIYSEKVIDLEARRFLDVIKGREHSSRYDTRRSGSKSFMIFNKKDLGILGENDCFAFPAPSVLCGRKRGLNFSKSQKKIIFSNNGNRVFNAYNNCYTNFQSRMIKAYYNFFKINFGENFINDSRFLEFANNYGGKKAIDNIVDEFRPSQIGYDKISIDIHHFPSVDTINLLPYPGFNLFDERLAIPLFREDHQLLHGKSEKEQVQIMVKNKWKPDEEISYFVRNTIDHIKEVEKISKFKDDLSYQLTKELIDFI